MPYNDAEKRRQAWRKSQAKKRQGLTEGLTGEPEIAVDVNPSEPNVNPDNVPLPPAWAHIKEFISRPTRPGDDSNLVKFQRIAGSLGKLGSDVWFGDLTVLEVGAVIGTQAAPKMVSRPV